MASDREIVIAVLRKVADGVSIGAAYGLVTGEMGLPEKQAVSAFLRWASAENAVSTRESREALSWDFRQNAKASLDRLLAAA